MSAEQGLIEHVHQYYDDDDRLVDQEVFIKPTELQYALGRVARLVGIPLPNGEPSPDTERNVVLSMTDLRGRAHPLWLGGVALAPAWGSSTDISATFWSLAASEHARLIRHGASAALLLGSTHAPDSALRMKDMHVTRVAPEDMHEYLARLNEVRGTHGMDLHELEDFGSTMEGPKGLYIAVTSENKGDTTVPVAGYTWQDGTLVQEVTANYPVTADNIFQW